MREHRHSQAEEGHDTPRWRCVGAVEGRIEAKERDHDEVTHDRRRDT